MNLLQLCEPTFLYICRLNRIYRNGGTKPVAEIKSDITELREEIQAALLQQGTQLDTLFESIELPFIYFIDSMIYAAGVKEWNNHRIAVTEYNRRAGDNEFFDFLEDAESDAGDEASEKLAFFYCCIGLGFTGMYEDDLDSLMAIMNRLQPRVRPYMDRNVLAKITPEAYNHNLEIIVSPESAPRYLGLLILVLGTIATLTVAILYLYFDAFTGLRSTLTQIIGS